MLLCSLLHVLTLATWWAKLFDERGHEARYHARRTSCIPEKLDPFQVATNAQAHLLCSLPPTPVSLPVLQVLSASIPSVWFQDLRSPGPSRCRRWSPRECALSSLWLSGPRAPPVSLSLVEYRPLRHTQNTSSRRPGAKSSEHTGRSDTRGLSDGRSPFKRGDAHDGHNRHSTSR